MGELLVGVLKELLHLGNLTVEEKHRYEDNVLKLEKEWYEEYNKLGTELGSDSALGDIELQLRLTTKALLETLRSNRP